MRTIRGKPQIILDYNSGMKLTSMIHSEYGHVGSKHVLAIIKKDFTFPNMYRYVTKFCNNCTVCIQNKSCRSKRSAELGFLGPASSPFEIMSLDTVGGFGNKNSRYHYLHILVDHFSRFAYIKCSKGQSARDMISLIDTVQRHHPIGTLLNDQYGSLSSNEFHSYCSKSGIRHIFTAVDCASSNGLNERLNQTLVNRIRCIKHDECTSPKKSWAAIATQCVSQYNNSPHSVTKFCPSYLLTGQYIGIVPESLTNSPNISEDRRTALRNTVKNHEYNKKLYDYGKNKIDFRIGDKVFVDNGNKLNREKLDILRIGPFRIIKQLSNNIFEVMLSNGCTRLYHASKLLKCK